MKLDNGVEALPSMTGFCFTILVAVIVLGYGIIKADVLVHKKDIDIMSVVLRDFYSPDEPFKYS